MEINGHEVIGSTLEEVLSRIQRCQDRLSMVVIPGPENPTLVRHLMPSAPLEFFLGSRVVFRELRLTLWRSLLYDDPIATWLQFAVVTVCLGSLR